MGSSQLFILAMIGGLALSIFIVMPKLFRYVAMVGINIAFGMLGIYLLNMILPEQVHVGMNLITTAVVGFLGLPGVGLLYALRALL